MIEQDEKRIEETLEKILDKKDIENELGNDAARMIVMAMALHKKRCKQKNNGIATVYLCRNKQLYTKIITSDEIKKEVASKYKLELISVDGPMSYLTTMPLSLLREELTEGNYIGIGTYEGFLYGIQSLGSRSFGLERDRLEDFLNCLNNGMIDFQKLK
jgi:hypothetical protein